MFFRKILTFSDHVMLQEDLATIETRCIQNGLYLNISKCNVMTFSLSLCNNSYDYRIGDISLNRLSLVKDLGIMFDKKLSFTAHYDFITSSAIRALGFVIRSCKNFLERTTFLHLYFAFVRSKLEYGSVVWSPGYNSHCLQLEKVQRRFLKFLHLKSYGFYPERGFPQSDLLRIFSIQSLESRRLNISLRFLHKLVNGVIDTNILLGKLSFLVPRFGSRNPGSFYVEVSRTNVHMYSPIITMCRNYNLHKDKFDLFNSTLRQIKNLHF